MQGNPVTGLGDLVCVVKDPENLFSFFCMCVFVPALLTGLEGAGIHRKNVMSCTFVHQSGFSFESKCDGLDYLRF